MTSASQIRVTSLSIVFSPSEPSLYTYSLVGANCFAPKIYCIEFAVKENRLEKKKLTFQTVFLLILICRYIVSLLDAKANNMERAIHMRKFHFTGR